ncbi:UNVERIFIED_CONTAM: hypothetical protein Sindi_1452800 [Sesamum indicum]
MKPLPKKLHLHGSDHPGMILTLWRPSCSQSSHEISGSTLNNDMESAMGQLYQIQREICSMTQGSLPLSSYFINMKRLWDEMAELKPTPQRTCNGCTCGAWKAVEDSVAFKQLMQFLMGLNNVFENVRHQLLVMEPVPSINKAYSIIQRVEKQKKVQLEMNEAYNTTLHVQGGQRPERKKTSIDKQSLYCMHCQQIGHSQNMCFKLHGPPDWYKELADKRKKDGGSSKGFAAQVAIERGCSRGFAA